MKNRTFYYLSVFFISSALLSLEIALMRILKFEGFGNFTPTAISLALLGFGAAGTIICLLQRFISGRELTLSLFSCTAFIFLLGAAFFLSQRIHFDPLRIMWDRNQIFILLIRLFLYSLPFTSGAVAVVLAFRVEKAGKAYFFNLSGSAFGIIILLIALFFFSPGQVLFVPLLSALIATGCLLFAIDMPHKKILFFFPLVALGFFFYLRGDIYILPYKERELTLNLPDAKIISVKTSPFGTLEVISSSKIRTAPGLSLSFDKVLPEQLGLFLDGDKLSSINGAQKKSELDYLLYQCQSAAYLFFQNPSVFMFGLGGGVSVDRALLSHAREILVIEPNPQLPPLIREITRNYSNYFFQNRNVSIVNTNARNYLKQDGRKWDIIELSTIESAVSSIGGIYSTSTDYQLTVEAFQDYLDHLNESGIFTLSVPLKFPPRNVLKIAHLCKKALENLGVNFSESIVILRNWSTGTILVKRTPFNAEELEILKSFCHNMFFDFVYYPGITETESNRYNIVEDSMYYSSIQKLFTDPKFVKKNYIFNVRAATDNQPYFHYFFKLSKIPELFRTTGKKWLFVVEGGYIVLSVTFVSTLILSYIFIGGPGLFLRRKLRSKRSTILIYFGCIALSYMFIEIMLIERFNKYLDSPIYSNSIIIASLLIFSGIGSYFTDFLTEKKRSVVLAAVLFLSGYFFLFLFLSDRVYAHLMRAHVIPKILFSVLIISPLGFAMGFPFPSAMARIRQRDDYSLAWAWSINGYFSVIASSAAVLLFSNTGLLLTGAIAVILYCIAAIIFP